MTSSELSLSLVVLASVPAFAQTTNISANPEADAFIREPAPTNNYGRAGSLTVAGGSATNGFGVPGGRADSLVRFRVTEAAAALDLVFGNHEWFITSAALRLYTQGRGAMSILPPRKPIFDWSRRQHGFIQRSPGVSGRLDSEMEPDPLVTRLCQHGRVILLFTLVLSSHAADPPTSTADRPVSPNRVAMPLPSTHIHQLFRVSTNLFSGSAPENEAAFAEIAKLGVKTIVSVDGSKPDVETARQHGLRYIHLPFGYDGIPTQRVAELVKAAQTAAGPIYVHCHHGLHRGPAAAAVLCEATAGWTPTQALAWLGQAGTDAEYAGLYHSVAAFRPPDPATLTGIVDLPEVAETSSLVETMVGIDEAFTRLKALQKADWSNLLSQPELTSVHAATILWEKLRELARTDDTQKRPEDYRRKLSESEKAADQLRALLRDPKVESSARHRAFQALGQTCGACHKAYRN